MIFYLLKQHPVSNFLSILWILACLHKYVSSNGRDGLPTDVSKAVAFLASDDASFTVGEILVVDGGYLACWWRDVYWKLARKLIRIKQVYWWHRHILWILIRIEILCIFICFLHHNVVVGLLWHFPLSISEHLH